MPCTVVKGWYPLDQEKEAVIIMNAAMNEVPVDESISVPLALTVGPTKNGMECLAISEVKPGKLEIALERWNKFMAMFHSIPGYKYEIKVQMSFE